MSQAILSGSRFICPIAPINRRHSQSVAPKMLFAGFESLGTSVFAETGNLMPHRLGHSRRFLLKATVI